MTPHHNAKLSVEQVREMRRLHDFKKAMVATFEALYSRRALAERFGVSEKTVEKALRGETWNWLDSAA